MSQLDLFPEEVARIPWYGTSPRALTRVAFSLFLRREPQKDDCFFVDPDQGDLFLEATRGSRALPGAPSLLPLPPRGERRVL